MKGVNQRKYPTKCDTNVVFSFQEALM